MVDNNLMHNLYKSVTVSSVQAVWHYGHCFTNHTGSTHPQHGRVQLVKPINASSRDYAIVYYGVMDTLAFGNKFGHVRVNAGMNPNGTTKFDTILVNVFVPTHQSFASHGGSGGSYDPHLDLKITNPGVTNRHDSVSHDPFELVDYDDPTYDIRLFCQSDTNKVIIKYPGTQTFGIATRPIMQGERRSVKRYNTALDIHEVEWLLKRESEQNYKLIKGFFKESEISLGARLYTSLKNHPKPNFGNWTTTGINSVAYNGFSHGPQPWDDFYYADWTTRIHKDDVMDDGQKKYCDCPTECRYEDGEYSLKTRVTNVRGAYVDGTDQSLKLDNWKPYIQSVTLRDQQGGLYYDNEWSCASQCLTWTQNGIVSSVDYNSFFGILYILTVETSESLSDLSLSVPYLNINNLTYSTVDNTRKTWTYEFNITNIDTSRNELRFYFNGQDKNNNTLVSFDGSSLSGCKKVPYRNSDTTWLNPDNLTYGIDTIHYLTITCSGRRPVAGESEIQLISDSTCLADTEVTSSYSFLTQGVININPEGGIAPYEIEWTDGNTDFYRSGLDYGTYCFELTDAFCCLIDSCITFGCPNLLFDTTIVHHCSGRINGEGEIHLDINSFCSVIWDNGSRELSRYGLDPGIYSVNINLVDPQNPGNQCYEQHSFEIMTIDPDIELIDYLTDIEKDCDHDGSIDITVWNGTHPNVPLQYHWSNGDMTQDIDSLEAGEYCLTISVGASCGDQVHCFLVEPAFTVSHHNKEAMYQHPSSCDAEDGWISSYSVDIDIDPPTSVIQSKYLEDENNTIIPPTQTFTHDYMWENLREGQYYLTYITDMGCKARDTFTLRGNDRPENHLWAGSDSACYDLPSGYAWIFMAGTDTIQYDFEWSNGVVHQNMSYSLNDSLYTGDYCVTVTAAGTNCSWDTCLFVPERVYYGPLSLENMISEKSCPFQQTGKIWSEPKGGTPPYRFYWNPGGPGYQNRTDLSPGIYQLTLVDDCDREVHDSIEVGEYPEMIISMQSIPGCPDDGGTVIAQVTGGNSGYIYQWDDSNSSTSSTVTGQPNGRYKVTVTDSKGCYQIDSVDLENFPEIEASLQATDFCRNDYDSGLIPNPYYTEYYNYGSVIITDLEGDGPFEFEWNNGFTSQNLGAVAAPGIYRVTITDIHGCTKSFSSEYVDNSFSYEEKKSDCTVEFSCGSTPQIPWTRETTNCGWIDCYTEECDCPIFGKIQKEHEYSCIERFNEETCDLEIFLPDNLTTPYQIVDGQRRSGQFSGISASGCYYCFEATYCRVIRDGKRLLHFIQGPNSFLFTKLLNRDCGSNSDTNSKQCAEEIRCGTTSQFRVLGEECCRNCSQNGSPNPSCLDSGHRQRVQNKFCDDLRILVPIVSDDGETTHYVFNEDQKEEVEKFVTDILNEIDGEQRSLDHEEPTLIHENSMVCYPNPVVSELKIEFETSRATSCEINVFASSGVRLISTPTNASEGHNMKSIDVSSLTKGVYFLELRLDSNTNYVQKFIK